MKKKGFTLIELLVVVAIIAVLATVVIAAIGTPRGDSRNSARLSQVREVEKALELYFNQFGRYPDTLNDLVTSGAMSEFPNVPEANTGQSALAYVPLGTTVCDSYHLGVILETTTSGQRALNNDEDRAPGTGCTAAEDFHGASESCTGTSPSEERCYDVGP